MRILDLSLRNVGPFGEARIEFLRGPDEQGAVTFLTGVNGTGKSIVLDAIRFWFGGQYGLVERSLPRAGASQGFLIEPRVALDGCEVTARVTDPGHARATTTDTGTPAAPERALWSLPNATMLYDARPTFVVDYWCPPSTSVGAYEISALETPNHKGVLLGALDGTFTRARTTQLICHTEFLRESRDPVEARLGAALQTLIERIINESLLEGRYSGLSRASLTPFVEQAGHRVPLSGISTGNAYQINRMLGLLWKMYSVSTLRGADPATLHETPGLLLIDEAENHLHPIWQKRFIPSIRAIFPNVQIVATTHSAFVLSSVEGARVYVCRYDRERGNCTISEETDAYASKPVDEVLASGAFDHTAPFGGRVTALLERRKAAIVARDVAEQERVERELVEINPTYFAFLEIDRELEALRRAG